MVKIIRKNEVSKQKIDPLKLVDLSNYLLTIIDYQGTFVYLNDEWEKILGFKVSKLIGKKCLDYIHPEDRQKTIDLKKYYKKSKRLDHFVNRYVHKDGTISYLDWSAKKVGNMYYCTARNITQEMKHTQIEKEMQKIGKIGWWVVNVKDNSVAWSDEVFRIYGLPVTKTVPVKKAIKFYPGEAQKTISKLVEDGIKSGTPWDVELPFKSKDNQSKWVHTTGYPIYNNKGEVSELFGVFKDITQDKIKKDQLRFYLDKMIANSQLATLGEISAGIAHEINNPLAIIQGNAERILLQIERGDVSLDFIKQNAEKIIATTSRISNIVAGLKSLARFDKEPFENVRLSQIMNEVSNMMSLKIKSNQIEFRLPEISDKIQIQCRPVQIEQVIVNLIANSIDAIQNLKKKWIEVRVDVQPSNIRLSVVDSGSGVPKEIQAKILEPFFTTKQQGKGTGLGLSISRRIISEHGGVLLYDPSQKNTTFVIQLPLSRK